MDVLVCIKRVPDVAGSVTLTDDAMDVDARHVGYTVSPHEECAVELAIQVAKATDGTATVLTVGDDEAVEQLRDALAVGCAAAVLVEVEPGRYGPADVAAGVAGGGRDPQGPGRAHGPGPPRHHPGATGDLHGGHPVGPPP